MITIICNVIKFSSKRLPVYREVTRAMASREFVLGLDINNSLYYFQDECMNTKEHGKKLPDKVLQSFHDSCVYGLTASDPGNKPRSRVQNAVSNQRLGNILKELPDVSVKNGVRYTPNEQERPLETVFQVWASEHVIIESRIMTLLRDFEQESYHKYSLIGESLMQQIRSVKDGSVVCESKLSAVSSPAYHPAFANTNSNALFRSTSEATHVLRQFGTPESKEVLEIYASRLQSQGCLHNQFIVVEGLDAVGKTTLTNSLAGELGAKLLKTPPDCLRHLRGYFETLPELIKRAYYTVGNAIVSCEIEEATRTGPVIMDRFWHSTAAYTIATECTCGDESVLPPSGHWCYKWPQDLVKPNVVLFLNAPEEVRDARLSERQVLLTMEETKLRRDVLFRKRLVETYRRMSAPCVLEIDASPTKDVVLHETQGILKTFLYK